MAKFTLTAEGAVNGKQEVFVVADGVRIARRTYAKSGFLLSRGFLLCRDGSFRAIFNRGNTLSVIRASGSNSLMPRLSPSPEVCFQ